MGLLKATLNGKELPIKITKVNRNVMPNMKNKTVQISGRNGEVYQQTSYGAKTISIEYQINNRIAKDLTKFRRDLSGLLYYSEPKRLIFSDEPNLYYDAIVTGEQTLDENDDISNGIITFSVPSGCAFSVAEKTAKNYGSSQIILQNEGTESVPLSVEVRMKSDNGYVGFILDDRFYQIGNPEEVDGETYEMTEMLFDDHLYENKGWLVNQGVTPPVTPTRQENGTIRYVKEYENEGYATIANYASGTSWHGASITKIVPADENGEYATNWKSDYRYDFNTDGSVNKGIEIGHNSVTYSDADGNIICSIVFEDNNPSSEQSDMYVYVEGQRVLAMKNMGKLFYDTQRSGRCVSVEKIGNQITVRFSAKGVNKTFRLQHPERELRKVTWYGAAYKSYTNIRNNLIRALNVYKHNVEKYEDIPNCFASGDVVEIDGSTGEVFINDIYNADMADIGSQTLLLPPGQHTLSIVTSSFSSVPDVEVSFREGWI